jgi:hypothetical protein
MSGACLAEWREPRVERCQGYCLEPLGPESVSIMMGGGVRRPDLDSEELVSAIDSKMHSTQFPIRGSSPVQGELSVDPDLH